MAVKVNNGGYLQTMDAKTGRFMAGSSNPNSNNKKVSFIDDAVKMKKIKEKANKGDKEAKDFLFNFRNLDEEAVKAYLSTIADEDTINDTLEELEEKEIEKIKLLNANEENKDFQRLLDLAHESLEIIKGLKENEIEK